MEADQPLAVALIDLDEFKAVNDALTYEVGDRVLGEFADILRSTVRRGDVAARLGGDEFVLVISSPTLDAARQALERLRVRVEEHPWSTIAPDLRLTMSAGIAGARRDDITGSMREAAAALQLAKRSGRNRVDVSETPTR